jgi:adenosine deaminase
VRSLAEHPFKMYFDRGFRVTLNTDDRLMSDTTMTKEFAIAVEEFGLTLHDLEKVTLNGIKSAFLHFDDRLRLIYDVIKPGYARARGAQG